MNFHQPQNSIYLFETRDLYDFHTGIEETSLLWTNPHPSWNYHSGGDPYAATIPMVPVPVPPVVRPVVASIITAPLQTAGVHVQGVPPCLKTQQKDPEASESNSIHEDLWKPNFFHEQSHLSFEQLLRYKTAQCENREKHNWAECPHVHAKRRGKKMRNELCRRNPSEYFYKPKYCPDLNNSRQTGTCPRGNECDMCHTLDEYNYHPLIYKQTKCRNFSKTRSCEIKKVLCPFDHLENPYYAGRSPRLIKVLNQMCLAPSEPKSPIESVHFTKGDRKNLNTIIHAEARNSPCGIQITLYLNRWLRKMYETDPSADLPFEEYIKQRSGMYHPNTEKLMAPDPLCTTSMPIGGSPHLSTTSTIFTRTTPSCYSRQSTPREYLTVYPAGNTSPMHSVRSMSPVQSFRNSEEEPSAFIDVNTFIEPMINMNLQYPEGYLFLQNGSHRRFLASGSTFSRIT